MLGASVRAALFGVFFVSLRKINTGVYMKKATALGLQETSEKAKEIKGWALKL